MNDSAQQSKVKPGSIFISYSRDDYYYAKRFNRHLEAHKSDGLEIFWDVKNFRDEMRWYPKLEDAIETSEVFVLLISPDYFDRDRFCYREELPLIAKAYQQGGRNIVPVLVSAYEWGREVVEIFKLPDGKPFQAFGAEDSNRKIQTLATVETKPGELDAALYRIAQVVRDRCRIPTRTAGQTLRRSQARSITGPKDVETWLAFIDRHDERDFCAEVVTQAGADQVVFPFIAYGSEEDWPLGFTASLQNEHAENKIPNASIPMLEWPGAQCARIEQRKRWLDEKFDECLDSSSLPVESVARSAPAAKVEAVQTFLQLGGGHLVVGYRIAQRRWRRGDEELLLHTLQTWNGLGTFPAGKRILLLYFFLADGVDATSGAEFRTTFERLKAVADRPAGSASWFRRVVNRRSMLAPGLQQALAQVKAIHDRFRPIRMPDLVSWDRFLKKRLNIDTEPLNKIVNNVMAVIDRERDKEIRHFKLKVSVLGASKDLLGGG